MSFSKQLDINEGLDLLFAYIAFDPHLRLLCVILVAPELEGTIPTEIGLLVTLNELLLRKCLVQAHSYQNGARGVLTMLFLSFVIPA